MNRHITEILINTYGIDISGFDESFVKKNILQRMDKTGCTDIATYSRLVSEHGPEAGQFLESLMISYTEFFRNPLSFSAFERILLPEIIFSKKNKKNNELRIWSAACAAGQEAYSIAMILENFKWNNEKIKYRIFVTDSDEKQINLARSGKYTYESVGNVTLKQLEQWFIKSGNTYSITPELKKHCEFSVFDLLSKHTSPPDSIYGDFDMILCANILFYYKPAFRKIIIDKIYDSLSEDGLIITGEAERELLKAGNFEEVFPQTAIFRKKQKKV